MEKSFCGYYAENIMKRLQNTKEAAIFGARIVAVEVASCLTGEPCHMDFSYSIVSNPEDNPSELLGRKVISLKDAQKILSPETLIIIACMEKHLEDITGSLHHFGFYNLLPLTFESDLWSFVRGNYFIEHCRRNKKEYLVLEKELDHTVCVGKAEEVCVYTAKCHVDRPLKENLGRFSWEIPIQVGAELTQDMICDVRDNNGEHISGKNKMYCELTALYWIWKNTSSKYAGLCHYRRHFELDERKLHQLSESDIDVVLTIPILNFPSVGAVYAQDHEEEDWKIMMDGITKICPEYIESAKSVQDGIYYYAYNMFIARKSILDDYCSWLFPILSYCETCCKEKENTYQNRYIGFLAERLLTIYMRHHEDEYKIVHAKKHFIES